MAEQEGARRIALSLPGAGEATTHFVFSVRDRDREQHLVWHRSVCRTRLGL